MAPLQTPESYVSAVNSTPASSSVARAASTSGTRSTIEPTGSGSNGMPIRRRVDERERHVARLELDPESVELRVPLEPERLAVELLCALEILRRARR